MFESEKSVGSGVTATGAYLGVALVFSPLVLALSRPYGYLTLASAIGCTTLCIVFAWLNHEGSSPQPVAVK